MSEPLVTQTQLEGLLRRLRELESRMGRTEVRESPLTDAGTWTPAFFGSGVAGTFVYGAGTGGDWRRNGPLVFFTGRIVLSTISVSATGTLDITGLPFVGATTGSLIAGGATLSSWSANFTTAHTQLDGQMFATLGVVRPVKNGDNLAAAALAGGELATGEWRFNGWLIVG